MIELIFILSTLSTLGTFISAYFAYKHIKKIIMKKYLIKFGKWDSSSIEVPGNNIEEAMSVFKSKFPSATANSITCIGPW